MKIEKHIIDDITIITVADKINTTTAPLVEKYINDILNSGVTKVLIDLSELQYISSAGLRIFLSTAKKLETKNGKLGMCSLNEVVQEIFDISGFSTIFNVYSDEKQALSIF